MTGAVYFQGSIRFNARDPAHFSSNNRHRPLQKQQLFSGMGNVRAFRKSLVKWELFVFGALVQET